MGCHAAGQRPESALRIEARRVETRLYVARFTKAGHRAETAQRCNAQALIVDLHHKILRIQLMNLDNIFSKNSPPSDLCKKAVDITLIVSKNIAMQRRQHALIMLQ